MYIATHNIWDTDKADVIGRQVSRNSSLCGVQEINENPRDSELEDFMAGLGSSWSLTNLSSKAPIAFDTEVLRPATPRECPPGFQNRGVLRLHEGNEFTPSRDLSWAIFKFEKYPLLPPLGTVNLHLQHRAWNGKERNRQKLMIRRDFWYTGLEQAQWVIVNMLKHGLTTTWFGDYNRLKRAVSVAAPRQDHVAGEGIDQIYIAKGYAPTALKYKVYPSRAKKIATPSDHPLVVGNVQFLMP